MIKITSAVRAAVRQIVASSRQYDADTMQISRDGLVSARKDADKTYAGRDTIRYLVGRVDEMVNQDGSIQDGW